MCRPHTGKASEVGGDSAAAIYRCYFFYFFNLCEVDKTMFMVGSYGPKTEPHIFQTPIDEAPSGLVSRGHYTIKSLFTDDDKNVYLEWEWALDIKKEWE